MDPRQMLQILMRQNSASLPEQVVQGRRLPPDPFGIPPHLRGLMGPRTQPMVPSMDPASMPSQPGMGGSPMSALPSLPQQPTMPQESRAGLPLLDRLRNGIELPDKPEHYKHRGSQNFLRGLVHGFKYSGGGGPGAGGGRGAGAASSGAMNEYQRESLRLRALGEERQAKLMESLVAQRADEMTKTPLEAKKLEAEIGNIPADNARQAARDAEMARHNRSMEAIARRNSDIAMGNLKARLSAEGGTDYAKWPEIWKRDFSSRLQAITGQEVAARQAAAAEGEVYDSSVTDQMRNELTQEYVDRAVQSGMGMPSTYFQDTKQRGFIGSGGSSTTGGQAPAPTTTPSKGVPKKGSW